MYKSPFFRKKMGRETIFFWGCVARGRTSRKKKAPFPRRCTIVVEIIHFTFFRQIPLSLYSATPSEGAKDKNHRNDAELIYDITTTFAGFSSPLKCFIFLAIIATVWLNASPTPTANETLGIIRGIASCLLDHTRLGSIFLEEP